MSCSKRFIAGLFAGALVAGVSGCSSDPAEPTATGESDGAFPVTIDHIWGSTTVEEAPECVVVLGVTDSDAVLALGTVPVAVTPFVFYGGTGVGPWAEELLQGEQPVVLEGDEIDVEQVASLQPDLIVAISAGFEPDVYDQLAQLAPTLVRPAGTAAYAVSRDDSTRMIAQALGKVDEGEELIAAADAAFDDALAAHPEFAGAIGTVLLPYSGVYGAYLPGDARGQIMDQLGFQLPADLLAEDTGESFYVELSVERLNLADGDVLVVLTDEASLPVVQNEAVLQQLPVVAAGGLVLPEADLRGAMSYNTVLSAPFAVQQLSPLLSQALAATGS